MSSISAVIEMVVSRFKVLFVDCHNYFTDYIPITGESIKEYRYDGAKYDQNVGANDVGIGTIA
jgi:hypothetical protein